MSLSDKTTLSQKEKVKPVWAHHETFHPRYGWLKKGFDLVSLHPDIFTADNAPVRLGVGKNMVKAIRYWCHAFKVLDNDQPSDFGTLFLSDNGYDPYIEYLSAARGFDHWLTVHDGLLPSPKMRWCMVKMKSNYIND